MSKLPSVSSTIPPDLRRFIDRARESLFELEKQVASIASARVATTTATTTTSTAGSASPPHAPFGLATAVLALHITVSWDQPGYVGHAWTEVWRSATDDINAAALVAMVPGTRFDDVLDAPGQVYFWTRFINTSGSPGPFSGVSGVGALAVAPDHALLGNLNSATHSHLTATQVTDLTDAGDSALHFHDADRARANHTGTQAAETISNPMGFSHLLAFAARHG